MRSALGPLLFVVAAVMLAAASPTVGLPADSEAGEGMAADAVRPNRTAEVSFEVGIVDRNADGDVAESGVIATIVDYAGASRIQIVYRIPEQDEVLYRSERFPVEEVKQPGDLGPRQRDPDREADQLMASDIDDEGKEYGVYSGEYVSVIFYASNGTVIDTVTYAVGRGIVTPTAGSTAIGRDAAPLPDTTPAGRAGRSDLQLLLVALGILGFGGVGAGVLWVARGGGDGPVDTDSAGSGDTGGSATVDVQNGDEVTSDTPDSPTGGAPETVPDGPDVAVDYANLSDEQRIGTGGNAEVYLATLPTADGDVRVAIKRPHLSGTLHDEQVERLLAEAETWAKLDDHDNVVDVVDYGNEPLPWIAMEYMGAGHLGERAGRMDVDRALWTAVSVTRGVHHAHRRGVAHLDLKPANVLFRSIDGAWDVPKVADWGLSRHLLEHSLSIEGMTPKYAAPEQFDDEHGQPDDLTDIYQLGAVFYELFTGRPPFEGPPTKVMRSVLEDPPVPPSERAAVPPALDEVLMTALAKEKADRYDDIVYLRDALAELYETL